MKRYLSTFALLLPLALSFVSRRPLLLAMTLAAVLILIPGIGTLSSVAAALPEPEKLSLWSGQAPVGDGQFEAADATITVHRPAPDTANGAAVVICPGGGYGGLVTGAEGHGIAKWLTAHGIAGIVLEYRLPKGRPFVPLLDAQRAIRTVRSNAKPWAIAPSRVGIIGFSAGGHLASTAGTHFDRGDPQAADPIARESSRPDFVILIYPIYRAVARRSMNPEPTTTAYRTGRYPRWLRGERIATFRTVRGDFPHSYQETLRYPSVRTGTKVRFAAQQTSLNGEEWACSNLRETP